jgi:hypothetical protein
VLLTRSMTVVVAFFVSLALCVPTASAYQPSGGAVFNNPKGDRTAKFRIIQTVNQAIKHAPRGSRIQMSTYLLDNKPSVGLLIGARKRGVAVQVVMDGAARNGQTKRLARALNRDNKDRVNPKRAKGKRVKGKWVRGKKLKPRYRRGGPDRSYVVFCKGACRNGGVPNHTKYFTFTRTGKARNVIMVSSSNLNVGGAVKGYNDLFVTKSRGALIRDFAYVHREMAKDTNNGYRFLTFKRGALLARFYPKKRKGDPVMTDLSRVRCRGAKGGAGQRGRTAINISMFRWNNDRGNAIARRLVKLEKQGCKVSVVYGAPGRKVRKTLTKSARRGGIRLWDSRWDFDGDKAVDLRVHHKYMLINGRFGRDRSAWRVHTGSQNWGRSLYAGDENTLNIASRLAYRQYIVNWRKMAKHSRRIG